MQISPSRRASIAGCAAAVLCFGPPAVPAFAQHQPAGKVFYLDGAGGGGLLLNWGRGLKRGLEAAGYAGEIDSFSWQTQLGPLADHRASVTYKRRKASRLAGEIHDYLARRPRSQVTLIGLSAGTAVLVFTLEALPPGVQVENAILLSSSVSADYDLTRALRHVRNRMYVFTSEKDSVLRYLVPMSGTADLEMGTRAAGLRGFRIPAGATPETRREYGKVTHIHWSSDFGLHTDVVSSSFVEDNIAPLIMRAAAPPTPSTAESPPAGLVLNPDYERWSGFGIRSSVTFEGHATVGEERRPVRITETLLAHHRDGVTIERSWDLTDDTADELPDQTIAFAKWIEPSAHPLTHPQVRRLKKTGEPITVSARELECTVTEIRSDAEVGRWGSDLRGELWVCDDVPGGIVRAVLTGRRNSETFAYDATAVAFGARPR